MAVLRCCSWIRRGREGLLQGRDQRGSMAPRAKESTMIGSVSYFILQNVLGDDYGWSYARHEGSFLVQGWCSVLLIPKTFKPQTLRIPILIVGSIVPLRYRLRSCNIGLSLLYKIFLGNITHDLSRERKATFSTRWWHSTRSSTYQINTDSKSTF